MRLTGKVWIHLVVTVDRHTSVDNALWRDDWHLMLLRVEIIRRGVIGGDLCIDRRGRR